MGALKSGDQEVRAGNVSVKCTEKTGFLRVGFFGSAKMAFCGGQGGLPQNYCTLEDQKLAAGCIVIANREAKWKSQLKCLRVESWFEQWLLPLLRV
jgi:hypothetical protein